MMNKNLKKLYKQQVLELMQIINKFDPFGLIEVAECPADEYSPEVSDILVGLNKCNDANAVSTLVSSVFNEAFAGNQTSEDYAEPGQAIWEWWTKQQIHDLPYERDHAFLEFEAWKDEDKTE
jgi:hypothetical protein